MRRIYFGKQLFGKYIYVKREIESDFFFIKLVFQIIKGLY